MKQVNVKFFGFNAERYGVFVDGEHVEAKRDKSGSIEFGFTTEKETVDFQVIKYLEINGPLWFLFSLLFFFVGIFGIFSPRYGAKCIVMDYRLNLTPVKDVNKVAIRFMSPLVNGKKVSGKVATVESDCEVQEIANEYYVDEKARKRIKIKRAVEVVLWLVAIAVTAIVVISSLS